MRRALSLLLSLVLLAPSGCRSNGGETASDAPQPPPAAEPERTTPLKALAETQSLEIRTALRGMNEALLNFYILNDRYPRDLAELESNATTAAELAGVRNAADSVDYAVEGGGYRLVVHVRNGPPLTMQGEAPVPRPEAP